MASCVADVVAIADALGYDRFYCSGGSGGAPHSIACAALIPDRVIGVAAIATPAPFHAHGLDWMAGMGEENIKEYGAADSGERELRQYLEREADAVNGVTPGELLRVWGSLFCDADRHARQRRLCRAHRATARAIAGSGHLGMARRRPARWSADWGFELDQVAAPLHLWHGAEDHFIPLSHGEWLAGHLPGAKAHLRPAEGHLSITLSSYGEILDALTRGLSGSKRGLEVVSSGIGTLECYVPRMLLGRLLRAG